MLYMVHSEAEGRNYGPFSEDNLRIAIQNGKFPQDAVYTIIGEENWKPVNDANLLEAPRVTVSTPVTPPPLPKSSPAQAPAGYASQPIKVPLPYMPYTRTSTFACWTLFIVAGIMICGGEFVARQLQEAGEMIGSISSQDGRTLEEHYYHYLGRYAFPAFSWIVRGLGLFCGTVLWEMGRKLKPVD